MKKIIIFIIIIVGLIIFFYPKAKGYDVDCECFGFRHTPTGIGFFTPKCYGVPHSCNDNLNNKCLLEPDKGLCEARIPKYYYDKEVKECKQFFWGGCDGVVPFETIEECQNICE